MLWIVNWNFAGNRWTRRWLWERKGRKKGEAVGSGRVGKVGTRVYIWRGGRGTISRISSGRNWKFPPAPDRALSHTPDSTSSHPTPKKKPKKVTPKRTHFCTRPLSLIFNCLFFFFLDFISFYFSCSATNRRIDPVPCIRPLSPDTLPSGCYHILPRFVFALLCIYSEQSC